MAPAWRSSSPRRASAPASRSPPWTGGWPTTREAAELHDIGKVYVPALTLGKPASELGPAERRQLEGRFESAYQLGLGAGLPEQVCEWLRRSGERWDGAGPGGLAGDAIPIE